MSETQVISMFINGEITKDEFVMVMESIAEIEADKELSADEHFAKYFN